LLKSLINNTSDYTKTDVVRGLKKGQQWAQVAFYDMYFKPAFYTAYRIINNKMDAEDAVHEGFIKAFNKIDGLQDEKAAEGWLKRIVLNEALQSIRKNKPFTSLSEDENIAEDEETEENPYEGISLNELNECVNELPEGYRVISQLYLIEEMKHDEIAKSLGISTSTSRSQLARAKKQLKAVLLKKMNR